MKTNTTTVCDTSSLIDFVRHNNFHFHFNADPEWSENYDEDEIEEIINAIDRFNIITEPEDIEIEIERLGIANDETDNYFYVRASDANINLVIAIDKKYNQNN